MTALLPELAVVSGDAVRDGELVALNEEGKPHFPLVCERLLHGKREIPLSFVAFDVLRG
jgi:ATP-dependent DNA ligase